MELHTFLKEEINPSQILELPLGTSRLEIVECTVKDGSMYEWRELGEAISIMPYLKTLIITRCCKYISWLLLALVKSKSLQHLEVETDDEVSFSSLSFNQLKMGSFPALEKIYLTGYSR